MKRFAPFALLLATSCARFPGTDGAASQFPRITFRIQMRGNADDRPIAGNQYYVAIRTITDPSSPSEGAPVQVAAGIGGPGNGFVAGKPTHFVLFDPAISALSPYRLYKFQINPTDPDDPKNLTSFFDTSNGRGRILNFSTPSGGNPNELYFELFLNQLSDTDDSANEIRYLQVNILTMNVKADGSNDNIRSWDALGDSRPGSLDVVSYLNIDVKANRIFDNRDFLEPIDDVQGRDNSPSLDIQNFSIEVTQP
ncbi:hypothetical protein EON81_11070 [bacterium]|nr:MAG: hypothetical protein EON81_11070 [bacterium]